MNIPDAEQMAKDIAGAVDNWNSTTDRGQQSARHEIGISDIGFCREFVRLMTIEEEFTDEVPMNKAFIGTWIGEGLEIAIQAMFPSAILKSEVKVTLPSGLTLTGHPDIILPKGVLDVKTVDGLTAAKRNGPSYQQQIQRHLYAAALVQAGKLPEDCFVGNVWYDRSGRDPMPYVNLESYDPTWLKRADEWISDVNYAVLHNERASQDQPVEFCENHCEYFSICRGEDVRKDREGGGVITDPFTVDYIQALVEAREAAKEAEKIKEDARRALAGVSGTANGYRVRWVYVGPSDVPGYTRVGYEKLDVRKIPKPKVRKKK